MKRNRLGLATTILAALAAVAAAVSGCAPAGPTEQELRAALIEQVHQDDAEYNQRMDRWGAPRPEVDGSSFTMTRSHRAMAVKPAQIKLRRTGGRTTTYEADVPKLITTTIKSGLTEEECLAAPERQLPPQRVNDKYHYDNVRNQWHEVKFSAPGGLPGL
jgi:hypothetical protein